MSFNSRVPANHCKRDFFLKQFILYFNLKGGLVYDKMPVGGFYIYVRYLKPTLILNIIFQHQILHHHCIMLTQQEEQIH